MSTRAYLLSPKAEGVPRLVQASSRAQALTIVAQSTWDATPADAETVRALGYVGIHVEPVHAELDLLAGAEGGGE